MLVSFMYVVVGLILLMGASDRFVESAVRLARTLGISIVLIGALIVGLGTSLPELLVSAIASVDGKLDVAMIQSLVRKDCVRDVVADYGQVIVDECHHIPAVSFERVLSEAKARYVVGLTATPRRRC